jgi:hypothetical protein
MITSMTELLEANAKYRQLAIETVVIELRGQNGRYPLVEELRNIGVKRLIALRECNRLFAQSTTSSK